MTIEHKICWDKDPNAPDTGEGTVKSVLGESSAERSGANKYLPRDYTAELIKVQYKYNNAMFEMFVYQEELKKVKDFFHKYLKNTWKTRLFYWVAKKLIGVKLDSRPFDSAQDGNDKKV